MQQISCQGIKSNNFNSFLPVFLVKFATNFPCSSTFDKDVNKKLTKFFFDNNFSIYATRIADFSNMTIYSRYPAISVKEPKIVFKEDTVTFQSETLSGISDIYIISNLSQTNQSRFLELHSHDYLPRFRVILPAHFVSFYFPTVWLPHCSLTTSSLKAHISCYHSIMISPSILNQMSQIKVLRGFPALSHIMEHLILQPQCQSQHCKATFVSWNQAHNLCNQNKLHLPSVFSLNDMIVLRDQLIKQNFIHSKVYIKDKFRTQVLYETISIYIGLKHEVSLRKSAQSAFNWLK